MSSDQFLEKSLASLRGFADYETLLSHASSAGSKLATELTTVANQSKDTFLKHYPAALEQTKDTLMKLIPKDSDELKKRGLQVALAGGILLSFRLIMRATATRSSRFTDRGPIWSAASSSNRKKTVRIYFLRHGESKNNARSTGAERLPDPPLTTLGEQQSIAAGHYVW